MLEWLTQQGETASIVVLLLLALWGRYKQFWVDGPTHAGTVRDLEAAEAELKKQNTTLAELVAHVKQSAPEARR